MKRSKVFFGAVTAMICGFLMVGCSSSSEEKMPDTPPVGNTAPTGGTGGATGGATVTGVPAVPGGSFVTIGEFSLAKLVHVSAQLNKTETINGSCHIEDLTANPGVASILKRALKTHNIAVVDDKSKAVYSLRCSMEQQFAGRRTYTTMRISFTNVKEGNVSLWSGVSSISGRGRYPVGRYAASLAGALMYNFQRFAVSNVSRRMLQAYYPSLAAAGE